jgi:flagellar biosynthesis protein FliR
MAAEVSIPLAAVQSFLFVLMRIAGAVVFTPLPGIRNAPVIVRISLILTITFALFPFWPVPQAHELTLGRMVVWSFAEAALGISAGLVVTFLLEIFQMAAQLVALQAGFSYASTIDPQSQADSSVLQVIGQLVGALLFVSFGLERQVFAAFARSLENYPPGTFVPTLSSAEAVIHLGASIFTTGLRLAFPILALLLLIDVVLALLSRINAHLQLLSLAFPMKVLASLLMFAALTTVFPSLFRDIAARSVDVLAQLMSR